MSSPANDPAATLSEPHGDSDPEETAEWLESFDAAVATGGRDRGAYLVQQLVERAQGLGPDGTPAMTATVTPFVNTIDVSLQPEVPGDLDLQERLEAAIRWNAAVMVSRANRKGLEVGGHIATYQSVATLYEVGLTHFFRGKDHAGGGDHVFFQGHASPGVYARGLLEGRFSTDQLDGFRQEVSRGPHQGLSSYPHPRLMPHLWEFPTVSMGLASLNSIYQARFNRYLHHRGISDTSDQHVWTFLGDGEMSEPESLGAIAVASRERLDNLTFVVNCNLQQLDGPVRGNGKILQELESIFRGAGWNVIKVVWGSEWDDLFARDRSGELVRRLTEVPDGQFQTFTVESGAYMREKLFDTPTLAALVEHIGDDDLRAMSRGGNDRAKVYAAYRAAIAHKGSPTVILAHTVKGYGISSLEGRNATHQMKKLTKDDVRALRDRLRLPISDAELAGDLPPYYDPGPDSDIAQFARRGREELGGFVPERRVDPVPLDMPDDAVFAELTEGSGKQKVATTLALVRLLRDLIRTKEIGRRIVPIAPDEYRTFGMDSLFPSAKIYDPLGQLYESVDRKQLLQYKLARDGQLLHESINEAGCVGSTIAAATAYATHGEPMIPFYIFYSMFGFQRTGDFLWALSDQLGRGFVVGATAGRTTLTGEGLQHADGHSLLLASTNPAVVAYDPAFAFEVSHIMRSGLHRMYGSTDEHPHGEDVWFYLTVYNEPISQPRQPDGLDVDALLKGAYLYASAPGEMPDDAPRITLMASGVSMPWALRAQQMLADEWDVAASVWSVTSWNELRRDAVETEKWNLLHPEELREPYVTSMLREETGPVLAVSDWMRAVPDQISRWVPGDYTSLGTDGFGFADTRAAARRFFAVDAESIVVGALGALARRDEAKVDQVAEAVSRYRIDDPTAVADVAQEGAGA